MIGYDNGGVIAPSTPRGIGSDGNDPQFKSEEALNMNGSYRLDSVMYDLGPRYINLHRLRDGNGNFDDNFTKGQLVEQIMRSLPTDVTVEDIFAYCMREELQAINVDFHNLKYNEYYERVKYIASQMKTKEEKEAEAETERVRAQVEAQGKIRKIAQETIIQCTQINLIKTLYGLEGYKLTDDQLFELSEYMERVEKYL